MLKFKEKIIKPYKIKEKNIVENLKYKITIENHVKIIEDNEEISNFFKELIINNDIENIYIFIKEFPEYDYNLELIDLIIGFWQKNYKNVYLFNFNTFNKIIQKIKSSNKILDHNFLNHLILNDDDCYYTPLLSKFIEKNILLDFLNINIKNEDFTSRFILIKKLSYLINISDLDKKIIKLNFTNYNIECDFDMIFELIDKFSYLLNLNKYLYKIITKNILCIFELKIDNFKHNKNLIKIFYKILSLEKSNNFFKDLRNQIWKKFENQNIELVLNLGIHFDLVKIDILNKKNNKHFWINFLDDIMKLINDNKLFFENFNFLRFLRTLYDKENTSTFEQLLLFKLENMLEQPDINKIYNNNISYFCLNKSKLDYFIFKDRIKFSYNFKKDKNLIEVLPFELLIVKYNNKLLYLSQFQYRILNNLSNFDNCLCAIINENKSNEEFIRKDIDYLLNHKYPLIIKAENNYIINDILPNNTLIYASIFNINILKDYLIKKKSQTTEKIFEDIKNELKSKIMKILKIQKTSELENLYKKFKKLKISKIDFKLILDDLKSNDFIEISKDIITYID